MKTLTKMKKVLLLKSFCFIGNGIGDDQYLYLL